MARWLRTPRNWRAALLVLNLRAPKSSWVKHILSRPGLVRSIHRSFPWTFIVRGDAYPVAGGNWTQLTISLANFHCLAHSPARLWVLSMANCDDKAMETLETLWKSNWEVFLSPRAFRTFDFFSS